MANTSKNKSVQALYFDELRERVGRIQTDLADQDMLIELAMEKVDGAPNSTGALLRSIGSFNSVIYDQAERLFNELNEKVQEGGV